MVVVVVVIVVVVAVVVVLGVQGKSPDIFAGEHGQVTYRDISCKRKNIQSLWPGNITSGFFKPTFRITIQFHQQKGCSRTPYFGFSYRKHGVQKS